MELAPLVKEDSTVPQRAALQSMLDPADGAGTIGLLASRELERVAKGCSSKAKKGRLRREGSFSEQRTQLDPRSPNLRVTSVSGDWSRHCQGGTVVTQHWPSWAIRDDLHA